MPATSRETAAVLTAAIGMVDGRNQNDEIDRGSPTDSSLGRTDDRRLQPDAASPPAAPTGIELLTARYATGEDAQAWRQRGVTMAPRDAVEAALADSALPGALALAVIETLRGLHAELDAMDARVAQILEGSVPYPEIGIALGGVTRQSAKAWIQSRLTRIPEQ